MNDELRHQLAALLGWQETDNGWITPDGDFYCWHGGYCLENRGRDAALARALNMLPSPAPPPAPRGIFDPGT